MIENGVNRAIRGVVKKMLEEGRYDPYVHDVDGNGVEVGDIDIITCFYGVDAPRLESTKLAMSLFGQYKARPRQVIVAEAQYGEDAALLEEFSAEMGFKYVFVRLTEKQRGIYVRQALLNIATKFHSTAGKLLYIDSDIGFCNPYWVKNVSLLLDGCDVAQPFGYVYYAYRGKYEPVRDRLEKSALKKVVDDNSWYLTFNTGFAFAMTRKTFDRIGGFDVLASPGEDLWFWHLMLGFYSSEMRRLPYQTFLDDSKNTLCRRGRVKTNDEVCFHIEHGTSSSRRYAAYVYASNRQSPYQFCDIDYDKGRPEILPEWRDGVWPDVKRKTIEEIGLDDGDLYADVSSSKARARAVINNVNAGFFGKMPAGAKVRVVTALDGKHSTEDVVLHKKLFESRFKSDFEYLCLSDDEIDGVQTLRPSEGVRPQFRIIDAFRRDVARGGPTLYVSLDVVPVDAFELCRPPDMFIGLNNPRHSNVVHNIWKLYLCNAVLFSGDFSFVYDDYANGTGRFDCKRFFMQPDQYIAYSLYSRGVEIRPLSQFVDVTTVNAKEVAYADYVNAINEMADLGKFAGVDLVARRTDT